VRRFVAIGLFCVVAVSCGGSGRSGGEPRELLPDLDQVEPRAVSVQRVDGRDLLVFVSAVDNLGDGPVVLDARRETTSDSMDVVQVIERADGSTSTRRLRAELLYVDSETHSHWHLEEFERYELRRTDGASVGRDRKTGFCLGDRYERTSVELPRKPSEAVWDEECGKDEPDALRVQQGISPGYGDDYVPRLEGQSIDVTGLPAGRYVLVHRVNPDRVLAESDHRNNAASVLIDVELTSGRITANLIASCPDDATCREG
jgi:hypothetical protein